MSVFLWVPGVEQDCHQLFKVTLFHVSMSQSQLLIHLRLPPNRGR